MVRAWIHSNNGKYSRARINSLVQYDLFICENSRTEQASRWTVNYLKVDLKGFDRLTGTMMSAVLPSAMLLSGVISRSRRCSWATGGADLNARSNGGTLPNDIAATEAFKQAIRDEPRRRMDHGHKRATEQDRHPNAATSASASAQQDLLSPPAHTLLSTPKKLCKIPVWIVALFVLLPSIEARNDPFIRVHGPLWSPCRSSRRSPRRYSRPTPPPTLFLSQYYYYLSWTTPYVVLVPISDNSQVVLKILWGPGLLRPYCDVQMCKYS